MTRKEQVLAALRAEKLTPRPVGAVPGAGSPEAAECAVEAVGAAAGHG